MTPVDECQYDIAGDALLADGLPVRAPYAPPEADLRPRTPGTGPLALDYLVPPERLLITAGPDDVTFTADYPKKNYDGRSYKYEVLLVDDH